MPTRVVETFEGGLIRTELDYDNANRITAVRVVNDSDRSIYLEVVQGDAVGTTGRKYSATFLAHTTTEIPIPTGQALKIEQIWDSSRNRWDGISVMSVLGGMADSG